MGEVVEMMMPVGGQVSMPLFDPDGPHCSRCHSAFGVLTRRHHCRVCGSMICDACSTGRADLRQLNAPGAADMGPWLSNERVCDDCVKWAAIFYQDYMRFIGRADAAVHEDGTVVRCSRCPRCPPKDLSVCVTSCHGTWTGISPAPTSVLTTKIKAKQTNQHD
jgi:hypothetical protein